jgi:lysozyme
MKITGKHVALGSTAVLALAGALVTHWEGFRADPYKDVTGVLTACYGHTLGVQDRTYTRAECNALMQGDLADADAIVRRCIPQPIPPQIEAALVDAAYNIGPRVVCGSTIQRRARAGDWSGVCDGLLAWRYAGGKVSPGLLNRRVAERNLCMEGV